MQLHSLASVAYRAIFSFVLFICFTNNASAQPAGDYFPLELGNTWYFDKNDSGFLELRIVGIDFENGEINHYEARVIEEYTVFDQQQQQITVTDTTYFELFDSGDFDGIPFIYSTYPDSSKYRFNGMHTPIDDFSFFDNFEEQVTSSFFGNFNSYKDCYYFSIFDEESENTKGFLFAPDIGPVAYVLDEDAGEATLVLNDFTNACDYLNSDNLVAIYNDTIDVVIDDNCGIASPNEIIVLFEPNASTFERDSIRLAAGVGDGNFKRCVCNLDLELWYFGENLDYSDVVERKIPVKTSPCTVEVDFNGVARGDIDNNENLPISPPQPLTAPPIGVSINSDSVSIITVPDSGINFESLSALQKKYIYAINLMSLPNGQRTWGGWSFVDEVNNISATTETHGTKVLKLIIDGLIDAGVEPNEVKVLPLKTHNHLGRGLIFDVTCSIYYSIKMKSSIVNTSWGHRGTKSEILELAIDSLFKEGIILAAAAGNDSVNIEEKPFYPAAFSKDLLVVATSLDSTGITLVPFANTSNELVHVAQKAPRGTSYAAPVLTAVIAQGMTMWPDDTPQEIIEKILDCAATNPILINDVKEGKILNNDLANCGGCDCYCWLIRILILLLLLLLIIWFRRR